MKRSTLIAIGVVAAAAIVLLIVNSQAATLTHAVSAAAQVQSLITS